MRERINLFAKKSGAEGPPSREVTLRFVVPFALRWQDFNDLSRRFAC